MIEAAIHVVLDQSQLAQWALTVAAIFVILASLAAAALGVWYGRKASATVAGEAHLAVGEVLIAARPSVRAVGLFRLKFAGPDGAYVRVTEVFRQTDELVPGEYWEQQAAFGNSFIEPGETLTTTVLFDVGAPDAEILGWRVSFGFGVRRLFRTKAWTWVDQVFVPAPVESIQTTGGLHARHSQSRDQESEGQGEGRRD